MYTKIDETTQATDRKMQILNDKLVKEQRDMKSEIQREIVKVSTLFKEEISSSNNNMNAQFAEMKSLIQQLSKSE